MEFLFIEIKQKWFLFGISDYCLTRDTTLMLTDLASFWEDDKVGIQNHNVVNGN